jgi:beta-aspartyl-peptidase (threonine type)
MSPGALRLIRSACLPVLVCLGFLAAHPGRAAEPVIAIHGGAGTMTRNELGPELRSAYESALADALRSGYRVLQDGGSALDAVTAAIVLMEDSPLFNAGRGAVFTHEGENALDASIMDGATLAAGAVGGVRGIKNPILLARRVMEASGHVMLTGRGAEQFAEREHLDTRPPAYFRTERRWHELEKARGTSSGGQPRATPIGTVGAVARDQFGNLAAGTSTGGMTDKRWGRIGDSPIIGAGTYANNASCAVSATGHGEFFIRAVVAHDVCARVEYGGMSLDEAARYVVMERLVALGGDGGIIAVNAAGDVAMPFNTAGMYRGSIDRAGRLSVAIFADSPD